MTNFIIYLLIAFILLITIPTIGVLFILYSILNPFFNFDSLLHELIAPRTLSLLLMSCLALIYYKDELKKWACTTKFIGLLLSKYWAPLKTKPVAKITISKKVIKTQRKKRKVNRKLR